MNARVGARPRHADRSDAAAASTPSNDGPAASPTGRADLAGGAEPHEHAACPVGGVLPGSGSAPPTSAARRSTYRSTSTATAHCSPSSQSGCGHEKRSPFHALPAKETSWTRSAAPAPPRSPSAQQGQDMADNAADAGAGRDPLDPARRRPGARSPLQQGRRGPQPGRPMLNKVSSQAEAAARRGMEAVRDTSQQLRENAPCRRRT